MTDVVILDVGHGNCAVVYNDKSCVVIDAGPGTALLEFMLENEINVVEEILISHADIDHLKGVQTLLDQDDIVIRSVRLNSDAYKRSKQWRAILCSLDDRSQAGETQFEVQLVQGFKQRFYASIIEVLAPRPALAAIGPGGTDSRSRDITTNTISAVVRVRVDERSVLFTGDIDELGLELLQETGQDLDADVLVFPHHGGSVSRSANPDRNRSFADQLLAAVDPDIVVFSISRTRYQNPRPEIVEAVKANSSRKVMCTQMSRHCLSEPPHDDGHLANVFADGRRSGHCCAGSIIVSGKGLDSTVESHTQFVRAKAVNALCL